jgi:hypothetical protein
MIDYKGISLLIWQPTIKFTLFLRAVKGVIHMKTINDDSFEWMTQCCERLQKWKENKNIK